MKINFLIAGMFYFLSFQCLADIQEMDLALAIRTAELNSPQLKSELAQLHAGEEKMRVEKANYLPSIDAAAIAANGSPGAFGLLGIDNNISSADRIGAGVGVVIKQIISDFGRTKASVDIAKDEVKLQENLKLLVASDIGIKILQTYLECATLKSQIEDAAFTRDQAKVIASETNKFVKSGQRSIVERYLVDSQAMEAETLGAELTERVDLFERRLAVQTGQKQIEKVGCLDLRTPSNEFSIAKIESQVRTSVLFDVNAIRLNIAKLHLLRSEADSRPTFFALANAGYFDRRLDSGLWNYSAGLAISIPIFDGYRVDAESQRNRYEVEAVQRRTEAIEEMIRDYNLKLESAISSSRIRYEFLKREIALGQKAFDLAKNRYFAFKGSMVDLRDALKNINRIKLAIDESKKSLLLSRGEKAIFNGAIQSYSH